MEKLEADAIGTDDPLSAIGLKVSDYVARGVRLVWVVDPREKTVTIHQNKSQAVILGMDDEIDGSEVVPGYSCGVGRFFE